MIQLGFSSTWVELTMKSVQTVKYKVKIKDCLTEEIILERGLRQDDPLSLGMKTDRIRTDITNITFVFIFLSGFGFEYG